MVKKAVIYAYWTKELFDICRENVSHMATLPLVARHVIHADNLASTPLDRFAARLQKRLEKQLQDRKICWLHLCKLETCTYISLAAIYGLTAITKMLVAGWKHASFLCYSSGSTRDSPRCFIFRATGQENRTRFSKSALLKYLFD